MKTSTKLFIATAIFFTISIFTGPGFIPLSVLCLITGFIILIIESIKGPTARPDTSKAKYTAEARKACETVTPKRKQDQTPPWEQ